ncbi:MAG: hypothetical protein NVS2B12_35410 [Ktedonobacteraceae bacterium]
MRQLINDLSAAGAIVAGMAGATGADLAHRLRQVLLNCQWFILVQTPNALYSPRVKIEVNTALELVAQGRMQGVLVLIASPCNPQDIPPAWINLRTVDATQGYQHAVLGILTEMGMGDPINIGPLTPPKNVVTPLVDIMGGAMGVMGGTVGVTGGAVGVRPLTPTNIDPLTGLPLYPPSEDKPTFFNQPKVLSPWRSHSLSHTLRTIIVILIIVGMVAINLFLLYKLNTTTASVQANAVAAAFHATITAQSQATDAVAATTLQNPYIPYTGTLSLNDPLQGNDSSSNWDVKSLCTFKGGAYHVSEHALSGYTYCIDGNTDFGNFTYQVQMKIVRGNSGGIIFRADSTNATFYYLRIGQDGLYGLYLAIDNIPGHDQKLATGKSPFIHTGLNQVNLVGVVARGRFLDLYINLHFLASVNTPYHHGQIGVFTDADTTSGAEAVFSNAKVWQLV